MLTASVARLRPSQQRQILDALVARGSLGCTDAELAELTGLAGDTVRPRRGELVAAGHVVAAGTRKTKSGRAATVWIATKGTQHA